MMKGKEEMKYLLLLLIVACGAPKKEHVEVEVKPEVPTKTESEVIKPRPTPRVAGTKHDFKLPGKLGQNLNRMDAPMWDATMPLTKTCFEWDDQANVTFKFFLSNTAIDIANGFLGESTTNEICVENLVQGEQYFAAVSAYNTHGESELCPTLAFRPAYIMSKTDIKLVQGYDTQGRQTISFAGPPNVMESNFGFVQWSSDLVNWEPLEVSLEYVDGVYSFVMPNMGPRAFFRLGFESGVQ